MTVKELSQLYYLRREVKRLREKIKELKLKAYGSSAGFDGMPRPKKAGSKTERDYEKREQLEKILKKRLNDCEIERIRLEKYISSVEDSFIRQILELRFIDLLSWKEIADKIRGKNSAESIKKAAYRYIEKH